MSRAYRVGAWGGACRDRDHGRPGASTRGKILVPNSCNRTLLQYASWLCSALGFAAVQSSLVQCTALCATTTLYRMLSRGDMIQ
eukprot:966677-Prymnesium_polylepis.1